MIDLVNKKRDKKGKRKNARIKFYKTKWFIALAVVLFLIIVSSLLAYRPGKLAYQYAMIGKDKVLAAQDQLVVQDLEGAAQNINEGLDNFKTAQENFSKIRLLKYVPGLGRQLRAVDKLLITGVSLAESADRIAQFGLDIYGLAEQNGEINFAEVSVEQKEEILEKIVQAAPLLDQIGEEIEIAYQNVENIPNFGLLPQIHNAAKLLKEKIGPLKSTINQALPLIEVMPSVFGYPEERTYLFLLQNNAELRPTGGFIGTYGLVTLNAAEIETFWTDNIYNLDEKNKDSLSIEPPWQLQKYLNADKWFMRDSNWFPDFPTSALKAMWFYDQEGGTEKLDGVIAVTPTFIESLIALVGEITVHGVTFNQENFVEILQYQVEQGFYRQGIPASERKEVIGDMAKILMDKLLALPQDKFAELFEILSRDISQKQILLYLNDSKTQTIIAQQNWDGHILDVTGDYLQVVDCNLASLKSDPVVNRTINYQVVKQNNDYIAKVEIVYEHTGQFDWKTTRYRTYTRVYVPQGSQLISSSGSMANDRSTREGEIEQSEEFEKTYFGAFIAIEPKQTSSLIFEYKLPDYVKEQIDDNKYTLSVQKQSGTISHKLNLDLNFDKKVKSLHPLDKGQEQDNNKITFITDLSVDRNFAVNF